MSENIEKTNEETTESTNNIGTEVDKTFESINKITDDTIGTESEETPEGEPIVEGGPVETEVKTESEEILDSLPNPDEENKNITEELPVEETQELNELGNPPGTLSTEEPVLKNPEEIVVNSPEIIKVEVPSESDTNITDEEKIEASKQPVLIEGENTVTQEILDAYPELEAKLGDIILIEVDKPWTVKPSEETVEKPLTTGPIEFDPSNAKYARVQEILKNENYFNHLSIGKYIKDGFGIDNLREFHDEYKKAGVLSTPENYELVALLDELFPVIETEEKPSTDQE